MSEILAAVPRHYSIQRRICKLFPRIGAEAIVRRMPLKLALFLSIAAVVFKGRADLVTENVALRDQLSCLIHRRPRPKIRAVDRVFWVLLSRFWSGWKDSLALVKPATVVPTATFGILYVFFVLSLDRRRVLHFNVTQHPTAEWTAQQVIEACPFDLPGRFLIRDNDKIYGREFCDRVSGLGLEQIRTAFRSPWQNGFAERWIASLRRDCLDHVIPINERQLRRVIRSYVDYYHADRTHLGLEKNLRGWKLPLSPMWGWTLPASSAPRHF